MTYQEYQTYQETRRRIISENRSRNMRNPRQEPLPVPPIIAPPMIRYAYESDGTYLGWLRDDDEIPAGAIIKMQPAKWMVGREYLNNRGIER